MALHVKIIAPDHIAFDGEARSIVLPGREGEMEVLPGHAKFVVVLKEGTLRVAVPTGDDKRIPNTATGLAEIGQQAVTVFIDSAVV